MVEVDIEVGVRSIKALIKEAPRGWSPNPPNFQAERHELDVVIAALPLGLHCLFPGSPLVALTLRRKLASRQVYDA